MATLTIRNLADEVKNRLHTRALEHGRSVEEEAALILIEVVRAQQPPAPPKDINLAIRHRYAQYAQTHPPLVREGAPAPPQNLGEAIRRRFAKYGGVDLPIPPRALMPESPNFD